jgi:hypothetical protein
MSAFRTCRPLLVNAEQCEHAHTITTDLGFRHVKKGDWIVTGEDGECYIVDDVFFQRTFIAIPSSAWQTTPEQSRSYGA